MRFAIQFSVLSAMALAACSPEAAEQVDADETEETETAASQTPAENAFLVSYRREFIANCVRSAVSQGGDEEFARSGCTCTVDVMIEDLSMGELMNPSDEQLTAAAMECRQSLEQPNG